MNASVDSIPISLDAPIEGWDAFNSIDNMPPTAAIILENLIPGQGAVDTRNGSEVYVDLPTSQACETVASFDGPGVSSLLAAAGGGVWDVTDKENIVELSGEGTFGNDRWQHKNFRKFDESSVLIFCNGQDQVQVFDGAALAPSVFTNEQGTVLNLPFIGVEVFQGRCYYWLDNDNAFYYCQAGSYTGVIKRFDLGSFTQRGGKLVMITTWTQQDAGDGRDDFIVFVFSTGEILVYQGDDPEDGGFWEMVGRYLTAEPLSVRGRDKYGSDVIIMTKDGYVNLASIIQEGRTSDVPQFSRLITDAITMAAGTYGNLFGWDCSLFPSQGLFVFNTPVSDTRFVQHVLNTVTMRWCKFSGMNVTCLDVHDEMLFGGSPDGKVISMLQGQNDRGEPIQFTSLGAFNYLSDPGIRKHLCAAQVLSTHPAPVYISVSAHADFNIPAISNVDVLPSLGIGTWAPPDGSTGSYWDEDYWAAPDRERTFKGWQNVSGYGYAVSLLVQFALESDSVRWRSTNLRFDHGGAQ